MDVRSARRDLFPEIEPFDSGMLGLGDRHRLYWEQCGNPEGSPVVFLHGGPGAGASPAHRRFFDPRFYRIVVFDQRGCGRSKPFAEIRDNTTPHLISDMERVRRHLGIERWLLFGGSWGSTLALAYAVAYPEHCSGLIVRGIFLGTRREIDWFLYGMGTVFPEARRAFLEGVPEAERDDPLGAYYRRLTNPDPRIHRPAAAAWSRYESACSNLIPKLDDPAVSLDGAALALARIEAHYFIHDVFLGDRSLLDDIGRIRHLPTMIVQGRYDMVCPIVTADTLARALPDAEYRIVADAGHSALEPGIRAALLNATEAMKARVG